MNSYEFVFITKDGDKALLKNAESHITKLKGKVTSQDDWGEKPFAYKMDNLVSGHYHLWAINLEKNDLKTLKNKLNLEEGILRYLILGNN